ncbi:putative chitinase 10 [Nymphon striatum]|nr:putative chitinase 10 [Nymphon striatum]
MIPFSKCSMLWISMGARPDTVFSGVPFYGRIFKVGNINTQSDMLNYGEICMLLKDKDWDKMLSIGHEDNFASNGSHWIQYESQENLRKKVSRNTYSELTVYASSPLAVNAAQTKALNVFANGLGGLAIDSVDFDDTEGICGKQNPLLNSVTTVLRLTPEVEPIHKIAANSSVLIKTIGEDYCSVRCVQDSDKQYDCSRFTQCTFQPDMKIFLKKEFKCPVKTQFDISKGYCSDHIKTHRQGRIMKNENESLETNNSKVKNEIHPRLGRQYSNTQVPQCTTAGRFRIPTDCHKYQICQPSAVDSTVFVSEIENCLSGLVFSDITKSCLLPSQVPECSGGTGSTQVAKCTSVGYFRIPSNCSRYLICYPDAYNNNVFIPDLGECPQGLFFSQTAKACVLPASVPECSTKTNNVSKAAPLPVCTASGNFRLGTECTRYISCIPDANSPGKFITQIVNCPPGRMYSSTLGTCVPPGSVKPCSSVYPKCLGAGKFRLGTMCDKFLSCVPDPNNPGTFIAQIALCSPGLSFDPATRACRLTASVPECTTFRNDILPFANNPVAGKELVCTEAGNFNIGNQCDHFLKCIRTSDSSIIAKVEVCANGTVFSLERGQCVSHKLRPQCQNGVDEPTSTLFGRQNQNLLCRAAGNFKFLNSCPQYLKCTANPAAPGVFTSQILSCPAGMSFSTVTKGCLPSSQVAGCGAPAQSLTLAIPTCPGPGNFRLGLECKRYLSCVPDPSTTGQFITQIVNCPSGKSFSTTARTCKEPSLVPECMALSVPTCSAAGNFRIGSDCTRYLSCIPDPNNPGTFIIQIVNCRTSLAFSSKAGTCLPAGQVEHCPILVPTVIPTVVNTTFTPRCTRAGFFRIPIDCTKYLSCFPSPVNGTIFVPQILDCPPGLYFSEAQGICQLSSLVPECAQTLPASCSAAGLFTIPSDCSKYLECSPDPNGNPNVFIPEVKYCLNGLYFSPSKKTCLRPVDVPECGTGSTSGTTCTAVGLFRIPSDCSKYLRCNPNPEITAGKTFIPEVVYCYPGLFFSITQKACLRPKQVPECKTNGHGVSSVVPIQGCSEAGFFPITGDCTHYLACNPNPITTSSEIFIPSLEECPPGLFFSPSRRFCFRAREVPECRNYLTTGFPSSNVDNLNAYSNSFDHQNQYNNDHFYRENIEASASTFPQSLAFPNGRTGGLCSREGFEAVPNDCTKYIFCMSEPSSGSLVALVDHCPSGKLFSKQARKCLPQNQVNECQDRLQCTEPGRFSLPDDCEMYTVCQFNYNGELTSLIEKCPYGHLFSPNQRHCLPAERVQDCVTTQYRNKQEFQNCPAAGLFPITGECENYLVCRPDFQNPQIIKAQIEKCPPNYAFSAARRKCMPFKQVQECKRNVEESSNYDKCYDIGKFPDPQTCSKYLNCKRDPNNAYHLIGTPESCPPGMMFSKTEQKCIVDIHGDCRTEEQYNYQSLSSPIVECKSQNPVRDQNDCSRFYFCSLRNDGAFEAFAFTCPPGYFFNDAPGVRMCVPASQSSSFIRSCSIRQNEPRAILANSKICQTQGVIRKPNDCSHFYHCLIEDGRMKQIEFACPQDYLFSEKYSTCSLAGTEVPTCTANRRLKQLDNKVPFTCLQEGLFPHSGDCRQYFRCRYNPNQDVFNLSIGKCPKTASGKQLYFSTKSGQCDWSDAEGNAECALN